MGNHQNLIVCVDHLIGLFGSPFSSQRCVSAFSCSCSRKIDGGSITASLTSLLFARFVTLRPLSITNDKRNGGRYVIEAHVFDETYIYFMGNIPVIRFGEALAEVYKLMTRPRCKLKMGYPEKQSTFYFSKPSTCSEGTYSIQYP